jgi:anti-sigma B factor antagonist
MTPISVSLQQHDPPVGVVTLIGEHDAFSAPRLESELAVLLDEGIGVVVDLRDATFIDSQTLSALLAARHQADEADLGFGLVLLDDRFTQVHRLLDLTGLGSAFAVFPTIEKAAASVQTGQTGAGRTTSSPEHSKRR